MLIRVLQGFTSKEKMFKVIDHACIDFIYSTPCRTNLVQ